MQIETLTWDSEFFGYPVGSLSVVQGEFDFADFKQLAQPYRLVYLKSDKALSNPNLKCGDTKVVFGKKPENRKPSENLVDAVDADMDKLMEIGLQSGLYSRFALDKRFSNNVFITLYQKWVEGSVEGRLAYRTLTVREEGVPLGLITLGADGPKQSSIGLFAVDEGSRGKGVGRALLEGADSISFARNDDQLTVATQGKNKGACAVYSKYGFTVLQETYIYNYWNEAFTIQ